MSSKLKFYKRMLYNYNLSFNQEITLGEAVKIIYTYFKGEAAENLIHDLKKPLGTTMYDPIDCIRWFIWGEY